jgi:hypothetical protein
VRKLGHGIELTDFEQFGEARFSKGSESALQRAHGSWRQRSDKHASQTTVLGVIGRQHRAFGGLVDSRIHRNSSSRGKRVCVQ